MVEVICVRLEWDCIDAVFGQGINLNYIDDRCVRTVGLWGVYRTYHGLVPVAVGYVYN